MLTVLFAVSALSVSAEAAAAPMRPTTFVVDTRLSEGPMENFSELLVNPKKLAAYLKPLDSAEGLVPKATVSDDRITINDRIFFALGSEGIRPSSFPILDRVASTLVARPDIEEVSIQGHAARNPNGDVNLALSVQRTKAVVDYLVAKGVDRSRISSIGFGSSRQDDDGGNQVEFVIEKWSKTRLGTQAAPLPDASQGTGTGSLAISNEHSFQATISVNGTVVGTVGPYTHAAIHGLKTGLYDVRFSHTSGFSYFKAVRTGEIDSPIVPGGAPAAAVLKNRGLPAAKAAE